MLYPVTGGAGFIGSYVVHTLQEYGEDVHVLNDYSIGKRENLAGLKEVVAWVQA
jgi:UDP-glucose 4-epimerase